MKLVVLKGQYGWSISIKGETLQKEPIKCYFPIKFVKCAEPNQNCQIEVIKGFFGCYQSKESVKPNFVVLDYKVVAEFEPSEKTEQVTEEELPF